MSDLANDFDSLEEVVFVPLLSQAESSKSLIQPT